MKKTTSGIKARNSLLANVRRNSAKPIAISIVWITLLGAYAASETAASNITWSTPMFSGSGSAIRIITNGISGTKVVGTYFDVPSNNSRGFLYDGVAWTPLDVPSANQGTNPQDIDGNNIVGIYNENAGFLYNGSTWTSLTNPSQASGGVTAACGISGNRIVGYYQHANDSIGGFIYNLASHSWTDLNYPGAVETNVLGIDGNNIVGWYQNSIGPEIGFLYDGTTFTSLNNPLAPTSSSYQSVATGISGNRIVGWYNDANHHNQGFLYDFALNTWTQLSYPGVTSTLPYGIDGNNIIGQSSLPVGGFPSSFLAVLPEPGSLSLLAMGACGFLALAWRRKRAGLTMAPISTLVNNPRNDKPECVEAI